MDNYYTWRDLASVVMRKSGIVLLVLTLDLLLYGFIYPYIVTLLVWLISKLFPLSPQLEVISVVFMVFFFFLLQLDFDLEKFYWKNLFKIDKFYLYLLMAREIANGFVIIFTLSTMYDSVQNLVTYKTDGVKMSGLSQAVPFIVADSIRSIGIPFKWLIAIPKPSKVAEAKFLLEFAFLAVGVSKMIYFNTLFTYLRGIENIIESFIHGKPNSNDPDECEIRWR